MILLKLLVFQGIIADVFPYIITLRFFKQHYKVGFILSWFAEGERKSSLETWDRFLRVPDI